MATFYAPIEMAPQSLTQSILPDWRFSLFSVNLGQSSDPAIEAAAVTRVGGYGRQLGHLAEALEVVVERLGLLDSDLPQAKKDILTVFLADVAAVRALKGDRAAVDSTP